jgi:hypothetical protein
MQGEVVMSAQISYREHGFRERYSPAFGGTVERLPEGWVCGRNCDIGGEPGRPVRIDLVLMHPALGIALINRKTRTEGAEDTLRERLEEARFSAIFGGYLPILHYAIQPDELPSIAEIERAFDGMKPLSLAGGNAWLPVVASVVMPVERRWTDNLAGAPNKAKDAWRVGSASTDGRPYGRAAEVVPLRRVASGGVLGGAETEAENSPAVMRLWRRWALSASALPWKRVGVAIPFGACILGVGVLAVGWTGSDPAVPAAEAQTAIPAQMQIAEPLTMPEAPAAPSVLPILAPPMSTPPIAAAPRPPAKASRHSVHPRQQARPAAAGDAPERAHLTPNFYRTLGQHYRTRTRQLGVASVRSHSARQTMCNLYSITKGQQAIREFSKAASTVASWSRA